ncbi:hypothetical protein D3C85_1023360 [compost metagenome]
MGYLKLPGTICTTPLKSADLQDLDTAAARPLMPLMKWLRKRCQEDLVSTGQVFPKMKFPGVTRLFTSS